MPLLLAAIAAIIADAPVARSHRRPQSLVVSPLLPALAANHPCCCPSLSIDWLPPATLPRYLLPQRCRTNQRCCCCLPATPSSVQPLPSVTSPAFFHRLQPLPTADDCRCPLPSSSASRSLHNPFCLADPTYLQIQRYCLCSLQCCLATPVILVAASSSPAAPLFPTAPAYRRCLPPQQLQPQPKPSPALAAALSFSLLCFLLPLLAAIAFLHNRSLTCHIVTSLSLVATLTAANRLCPPLANADNLVAVKSYYIYDICP
ncbi:hypothetical protein GW17_00057013 [Ensete ventricosum]|nr:hypothetical protein GW17_00057013 [Ensete ventricosum]